MGVALEVRIEVGVGVDVQDLRRRQAGAAQAFEDRPGDEVVSAQEQAGAGLAVGARCAVGDAVEIGGGLGEGQVAQVAEYGGIPEIAAVLGGPKKGVFKVRRTADFDVSDSVFLPNGDLLLLERKFSFIDGIRMRLRRIPEAAIGKGALADGPVLMEADMGHQIDNMEGLDVWTRDDGALMVSLVSDDNHSILQRNLYLEFILHQD